MRLHAFLKLFRAVTAIIVISLLSMVFFDIYNFMSLDAAGRAALTQFVPSALSFIHAPSLAASSFIIVIFLTLAAGRSYCSFLCPLGIFQDLVSRISSVLAKKKNYRYAARHDFIRYSTLIIIILSYSAAGTLIILWLDPFSIYGRFSSNILSPAVSGINNIAVHTLSKFNIYTLHPVNIKFAGSFLLSAVLFMIISISITAAFRGRLYCNTICPVGTLLGIASTLSLFRIKIDKDTCIHCGKCERICKSSCIGHAERMVDFSRCVSCFNCLNACPNGSIKFKSAFSREKKTSENITDKKQPGKDKRNIRSAKIPRKSFLSGMIFLPSAVSAQISGRKQQLYVQDRSKQKEYKKKIFTPPPGSTGVEKFNGRCTACSLCISRCPSSVLQPAVLQYGIYGIMQPYLDFNTGYCNYDCIICSEVCPTGAIKKTGIAEKHLIQTGKSVFIKENCITYTNGTDCGACSEHCPTKAVKMVPFRNNLVIPEVNQAICIGCGACEFVCPVRPLKAMYVEGNRIHQKAELPKKEKKIEIRKEDFPF